MNMRTVLLTVGLVLFGGAFFILVQEQRSLKSSLALLHQQGVDKAHTHDKTIAKLVSKSEVWRPIQNQVKDTVVQVFSQIAQFDLLQPYKTPAQGSATGTGFFINDQGYLITNAHVVDQAVTMWIQIPSLGKRIIDVNVVGVSPDRDVALLRVADNELESLRKELGAIPFLPLGDSDLVQRSDEIMALGYPLGQQSLKSTTGVISGREHRYIQMSAPINPGNSGGPSLNIYGEVVGINAAGITTAQNVGYIIPINDLKLVLPDLYKTKLLRKPFLGVLFNNASDELTAFLGNPKPGGCYVVEVVKNSTLAKAGVQRGDMIYELNGYTVDIFGEMSVPWSEDKLSLVDYVGRLSLGQDISLTVYRNGERKELSVTFSAGERPAIRKVYPGYEELDYEVFAGMVVMPLTINHIQIMGNAAPGLSHYAEMDKQVNPALVITHIFPSSHVYRSRTLAVGSTIKEVNGQLVHTLEDLRKALKDGAKNTFLTVKASDNVTRSTDNIFVALEMDKVLQQEPKMAHNYKYPLSNITQELALLRKVKLPEVGKTVTA